MKKAVEKRLQSLLNKNVKYGTRILVITGYNIDNERGCVFIHTNEQQNHYDRPIDDADGFLRQFTIQEEIGEKSRDIILANANSKSNQLMEILLENIEKVRLDKEYIPQAQSITNSANTIINLSKLQLQAAKMQQGN